MPPAIPPRVGQAGQISNLPTIASEPATGTVVIPAL
jgi:hypothetical protein